MNRDEVIELQGRRLVFANFIAAGLFGRISALQRTALSGAQYASMHQIVVFAPSGAGLAIEQSPLAEAVFAPKVRFVREQPRRVQVIDAHAG